MIKLQLLNILISLILAGQIHSQEVLHLNDDEYFEATGVNIMAFSNWYNGNFSDSKISGVEIIHHGVRTVTNGDVRLHATPEQWDPIPTFVERKVNLANRTIDTYQKYPDYNFEYFIRVQALDDGVFISVHLDQPLPEALIGKAGMNLEFLPPAYFEKSYYMDDLSGIFPLYPYSSMKTDATGYTAPLPIAVGRQLSVAPEDPTRRITISSTDQDIALYDGRAKAQNGWFVIRSLLPADKTGKVLEWELSANSINKWVRKPSIAHSQVGYHPTQEKIAVIELDKKDTAMQIASLYRINADGTETNVHSAKLSSWGRYTRYNYWHYDFSEVSASGHYIIKYGDERTAPFRIDTNIYEDAWYATNDIFFPVQMDHMLVNEAYRVWHGASHLDDALQAPPNIEHFDLYAMGETDTKYAPGEHIPGLNVGGWYDAGDYDIRTQTQYYVISNLVKAVEAFGIDRDETLINQNDQYVDIHHPDGKADILQQIEHGVIQLLAQFDAVGHAIHGIIVSDISQYTHLGDGLTMTDNLVYDSSLDSLQTDCNRSGTFDDRWAFTTKATALNYGSIAAIAGAGRVLKDYDPVLSQRCINLAIRIWDEEQGHEPNTFRHGNTTGGSIQDEELKATAELLLSTGNDKYRKHLKSLWSTIDDRFRVHAGLAVEIMPYMKSDFTQKVKNRAQQYANGLDKHFKENPFSVPIGRGGWAGNGGVIAYGINNYKLHKAFPDIIDKEYVFKALNYIYGTHPDSDISFVSGVGTKSKKVAYGMNRADFSFIAGGIVPGVLILKPDFPENKEDWPYLWGENEYVISIGSSYLYLVNAVHELLQVD